MGISKKQFAIIAKAGQSRGQALKFLEQAGREPSPSEAFDKVGELLKGRDVASAMEGVKPIDKEISETQPKGEIKESSKANELIKPVEVKTSKNAYDKVKPISDKIYQLQKDKFDVESVNPETNFQFENDKELNELVESEEFNQMYDDIANNDEAGLMSHTKDYFDKYNDELGDGESNGKRNQFLETYMKPIYKRPKVLSKQEFEQVSQGKKILYRGVGSEQRTKETLFSDNPRYIYGGGKGDGTYFTDDTNTAREFTSGLKIEEQQKQLMRFILPDDLKTIDYNILNKIGARFSKRMNEKIQELEANKETKGVQDQINDLKRLQKYIENTQYTALVPILGFDGVEVRRVGIEKEGATRRITLKKNYVFLNLEKLIGEDIIEEAQDGN